MNNIQLILILRQWVTTPSSIIPKIISYKANSGVIVKMCSLYYI